LTERLHLGCCRKRVECPLDGALAGSKRKGQGRTRPRLTVGEEGEHCTMLLFDRTSQHDDFASPARHECKSPLRRGDASQRPEHPAETPDFDA
jgi:hypothetical protein